MSIFCSIVVFANGCALAGFAQAAGLARSTSTILQIVVGSLTPGLILLCGNLDHLLLLPAIPAIAALVHFVVDDAYRWRISALIGLLLAASFLTYVELFPLAIATALSFAYIPSRSLSENARYCQGLGCHCRPADAKC